MGLRDFLAQIEQEREGTKLLSQNIQNLRGAIQQGESQSALQNELPRLLNEGRVTEAIGLSAARGAPNVASQLLESQKPAKVDTISKTQRDVARSFGFDLPETATQDDYKAAMDARRASFEERESRRRETSATTADRSSFDKQFVSRFGKKLDAVEKLGQIGELDFSNAADINVAISTIIKSVGQDAGALSDQDVQRYIPRTVAQDFETFKIYLGASEAKGTPIPEDVRQGLKKLLANSREKLLRDNRKRAISEIESLANANRGRLIDAENGYIDETILTRLNQFGLKGDFVGGKFKVSPADGGQAGTVTANVGATKQIKASTPEGVDLSWVAQISDPDLKARTLKILETKTLSAQGAETLRRNVEKQLASKKGQ